MRQTLFLLLIAAAGLVASPDEAHADCARQFPTLTLLTPTDAPLPREASLIAVVESSWERSTLLPSGSADHTPPRDFRLEREGERIDMTSEVLAPGVLRLRPERPPEPGAWTVYGLHELATVSFSDAALPAPPSAPKVSALEHRVGQRRRWTRERTTHVTLEQPLEPAVMLLAGVWTEAQGAAMAVGDPTSLEQIVYRGPGSCEVVADGVTPPREGKPARLFAVDRFGQSSALSEPLLSSFTDTGE